MGIKKTVFIAVVALLVVVGMLTFRNLDGVVKHVIESAGPMVTGTVVALDNVNISLKNGRGELNKLTIANPEGFKSPYIFSMNKIVLQVRPKTLLGPVVVISEILIDDMSITAEQKGTMTNINTLIKGIKERGRQRSVAKTDQSAEPTKKEGVDIRLMVENIRFTGATLNLITESKGDHILNMPDIVMTNVGDNTTGLTPDELSVEILNRLLEKSERAVADLLKSTAKKKLEKDLSKKLSDKDRGNIKKLKSMFQ